MEKQILIQEIRDVTKAILEIIKKMGKIRDDIDIIVADLSNLEYKNNEIRYEPWFKIIRKEKQIVMISAPFNSTVYYRLIDGFEQLFNRLMRIFQKDFSIINQLFYSLVLFLAEKSIDNVMLEEKIKLYLNELNGGIPILNIKVLLNGIWLKEDKFRISDSIKLRRIKEDDFEFFTEEEARESFFDSVFNKNFFLFFKSYTHFFILKEYTYSHFIIFIIKMQLSRIN